MPASPITPRAHEYLESWAEELQSRASRVRQLIGSKHWLSDGFQKESILRAFFRRHLPEKFAVARGFVTPLAGDAVSPEVDILIANANHGMFWLNEADLLIVPPASVAAHIHVKTTLVLGELKNAIKGLDRTATICHDTGAEFVPWSGVFFFASDEESPNRRGELIMRSLTASAKTGQSLPNCISVLDGPLVLTRPKDDSGASKVSIVRIYDLGKLAPAAFLVDLYVHLTEASVLPYRTDAEELLLSNGGTLIDEKELSHG